jgi:hypothetical protein
MFAAASAAILRHAADTLPDADDYDTLMFR